MGNQIVVYSPKEYYQVINVSEIQSQEIWINFRKINLRGESKNIGQYSPNDIFIKFKYTLTR